MLRRAFSFAEVAVLLMVLSICVIPLYFLFTRTGETAFRSEIAYKAIHLGREKLEELRTLPLFGDPARGVAPITGDPTRWIPVAGKHILDDASSTDRGQLGRDELKYPESYQGVEYRFVVRPGAGLNGGEDPRVRVIRLEVRWKMAGKAAEEAKSGTQAFHAVVVNRDGA